MWEMTARAPGKELRQGKRSQVAGSLLDDQIVDDGQVRCREAQLGEHQVDAVHPECELILEPAHVGLLEAGTVGDHKGAFAFVNVLERGKATDTLCSPGVQIGARQLRNPTDRIIRIAGNRPEGIRYASFEGLFRYC